jgi:hemerythrin superfamily protein
MATKTARQDAVRFLTDQHELVRRLFEDVASTPGAGRREVFEPLVRLLAVHETAEEIVIYPAVRRAGDAGERVAEARLAEEDEAKKALAELERLDPTSAEFDKAFTAFRADVEAHADAEEREVFPLLEELKDAEELERMAGALRAAEAMAPTHPHKTAPESATGNLLVGPFVAMVDRVRDALRDVTRR